MPFVLLHNKFPALNNTESTTEENTSSSLIMSSLRQARQDACSAVAGPIPRDEQDSTDSESDLGDLEIKQKSKKSRKKPRTSNQDGERKRVKGVRGKLKMLTEMPLDVLFEVRLQFKWYSVLTCYRSLAIFTPGTCYVSLGLPSLFEIFLYAVLRFQSGKALFQTSACLSVLRT